MARELNPLERFICGGVGGIVSVLVGHPLDTVKVRLQTSNQYSGTLDCITKTIKTEGPLGLYKGIQAPLTGVAPIFALSFFGYGVGKILCQAHREDFKQLRQFGSGAFSGLLTSSVMAPFERIKCLLQMQAGGAEKKYNGLVDCAVKLYKEGGIRSIYRGGLATAMRDVPATGCYFLTYDFLTASLVPPGESPSLPLILFAGGCSGIVNWVTCMPMDTVKSRIQTAPEGRYPGGIRQVFMELMAKEGPGALFKGFLPVILRAFPANAGTFIGFEVAASALRKFFP